jgi:hypothetical protein
MDWRSGSSGSVCLQVQSPEFKSQTNPKKKKEKNQPLPAPTEKQRLIPAICRKKFKQQITKQQRWGFGKRRKGARRMRDPGSLISSWDTKSDSYVVISHLGLDPTGSKRKEIRNYI